MQKNYHGLISLFLLCSAVFISVITLFNYSFLVGSLFMMLCIFSSVIVLRIFCAKCPCRKTCGHVILGRLAAKIFPEISAAPFKFYEWLILGAIGGLIIGIPQHWLIKNSILFFSYWLILVAAAIEIKLTVCPKCKNEYCPSNPLFHKSNKDE
jgi:hypothetical protein